MVIDHLGLKDLFEITEFQCRKYLDDKVKVSLVFVTSCRCVRSDDQLSVNASWQVDVLSNWQAKDMFTVVNFINI